MPSNWPTQALQESGVTLIDCVHKTPEAVDGGPFAYVGIPQMSRGRVNTADARRISANDFKEWTRKALPQEHDVVISRRCNPGVSVYVAANDEFALGQNLVILRADGEKVYPPFLRWHVRGPSWWDQVGKFINVGAVFDSLRCRDVPHFELPLPPLPEQRAIAHLLGSLDGKIEQNRRTAGKLEELARAVFKAWFVDFAPVHAKADGATTYPGLPPDAFAACPTTFQDSPLGPIPQGWEVKPLDEACTINPKLKLKKGEPAPYLDMKNMPTQGHRPNEVYDRPFGSGMKFQNGDTLVARITPCLENGKTAFVDFLDDDVVAWGSTEYIVLRPNEPLPPIYGYCLARTEEFREFAIQNMSGTSGRQRVAPTAMSHYHVVVPPEPITRVFGETVGPLFDLIKSQSEESQKLAELRDYLLPRLLSGAVRVREAETIDEGVA